MKYAMMIGSPTEGFMIVGPFEDHEGAVQYLETEQSHDNCWIVELHQPWFVKIDYGTSRRSQGRS